MRPGSHSERHDAPRLFNELVPRVATVIDDVSIGREDAVRQPVVPHELPDIFLRIELRALSGQRNDGNVRWHGQLRRHVPSGLIHKQHRVGARCNSLCDFGKMQVHRRRIAPRKDEARRLALLRADGAEDVGRSRSLVVRCGRARAAPSPSAGDLVLLSYARFISPPDFDRSVGRERRGDLVHLGSKPPFLKASTSSSFWA